MNFTKFLTTLWSLISVVPKDNRHYEEGKSRYIWMTGGVGTAVLVDLEESVNSSALRTAARYGSKNQYLLYTRKNPTVPQIVMKGNVSSVESSNYMPDRGLKVIVHGWKEERHSEVNTLCTKAFLSVGDVNVIVVEWRELSYSNYIFSVIGVPSVGKHLAHFLRWLFNTFGGNWNNVHLVGSSLGAHIIGNAGRTLGGVCARLTALDAAGPMWVNNTNAISKDDGIYVEAIHTDGGVFGLLHPFANADFYPNGGHNLMPGCLENKCSHDRSFQYFASSVLYNHFYGHSCKDLDQARNVLCAGDIYKMGNDIISKRGSGVYGLKTRKSWPF